MLTNDEVNIFKNEGFFLKKSLLDEEETSFLQRTTKSNTGLKQRSNTGEDKDNSNVRLTIWNHPGNDIWGMVSRTARLVDAMEAILGGEVYHYHSKLLYKKLEVGGAWECHQDYGYWHKNGFLYPDLASCWIVLNRADKDNSYMQVIKDLIMLVKLNTEYFLVRTVPIKNGLSNCSST